MNSFLIDGEQRVLFNDGAVKRVVAELKRLNVERALLVGSPRRLGQIRAAVEGLDEFVAGTHPILDPQVPHQAVSSCLDAADNYDAEAIIAIGGGSAIGLGKAVVVQMEMPLIAVPTTFVASEMTDVYGVTSAAGKAVYRDRRARPKTVIYDAELFAGLPYELCVTTAMCAMAHSVEALYSVDVDPGVTAMAESSIAFLSQGLHQLATPGLQPRRTLLKGAFLAGQSLARAHMGLQHQLCHVLGGSFGIDHAAAHALMLAHVVAFNAEAVPEAMHRIARSLRAEDPAAAIFDLVRRCGAQTSLASLGFAASSIPAVLAKVIAAPYANPRTIDESDLEELLDNACAGRRPTIAATSAAFCRGSSSGGYQSGFGNHLASSAIPGAIPPVVNAPQHGPHGLYPEQINGTTFATGRQANRRTWLYRIRPTLGHSNYEPVHVSGLSYQWQDSSTPNLTLWRKPPRTADARDFVAGLTTIAGAGDPDGRHGLAIHHYAVSQGMSQSCLANRDGELLIVPEEGELSVRTELGRMQVRPGEICVIPADIKFAVEPAEEYGAGFVIELFGRQFTLPERGPIGANGLADERHFLVPTASYEDRQQPSRLFLKQGGRLFVASQDHSPFDVVSWHGTYVPYKYDLDLFNAFGSVRWDHPDPSILTVLTCPIDSRGTSVADFVIFPPRWEVFEGSFRPPFFHRNVAAEFNGILRRPANAAFRVAQGDAFYTPPMAAHGLTPASAEANFARLPEVNNAPQKTPHDELWFQVESCLPLRLTEWGLANAVPDFRDYFTGYQSHFDPDDPAGKY